VCYSSLLSGVPPSGLATKPTVSDVMSWTLNSATVSGVCNPYEWPCELWVSFTGRVTSSCSWSLNVVCGMFSLGNCRLCFRVLSTLLNCCTAAIQYRLALSQVVAAVCMTFMLVMRQTIWQKWIWCWWRRLLLLSVYVCIMTAVNLMILYSTCSLHDF